MTRHSVQIKTHMMWKELCLSVKKNMIGAKDTKRKCPNIIRKGYNRRKEHLNAGTLLTPIRKSLLRHKAAKMSKSTT